MVRQIKLFLLGSYYLVMIWFMGLTVTLQRLRYSARMWRVNLRGRGGQGRH